MKVAVLGAGNWGTTAALLLNANGHEVRLWEYNETLARNLSERRENAVYLPGFVLPDSLKVTSRLDEAVDGAGFIVFVVPSSVMRKTARAVADCGLSGEGTLVASLSKGLEHGSMKTMTTVIAEEFSAGVHGNIQDCPAGLVAMSGPCIAGEVAAGLPTTIVAASGDPHAAAVAQELFMNARFRVYTSDDPLGVQLGGALKNIIAIAAGINDGLGYGANTKSALITRGIVEITRFGTALGSKIETFNGLSGIGDLITTCVSGQSRNRSVGERLGKGQRIDTILGDMVMIAEGVHTTRSVWEYACERNIDMPITGTVYRVLFEGLAPDEAVAGLMTRDKKAEQR